MKLIISAILLFLSIATIAQPANDETCGAELLPVTNSEICSSATTISWNGATSNSNQPWATCGFNGGSKKDVWYKFTLTNSTYVNIVTSKGATIADYTMAVYAASVCSGELVQLACDDDSGPDAYPAISIGGLTSGVTYYIRLWAWSTPIDYGELKICINSQSLSNGKVGVGTNSPSTTFDVNGTIRIRGGNPQSGKKLTTDGFGNANWEDGVISTGMISIGAGTAIDTTFDGTCYKVYHIPVPQLTAEVLNTKHYVTYFKTGSIGPFLLPYISNAGGYTNQITCIYRVGEIIVARQTFNSCRFNSGSPAGYPNEPVMVSLPSYLEFRVVITK